MKSCFQVEAAFHLDSFIALWFSLQLNWRQKRIYWYTLVSFHYYFLSSLHFQEMLFFKNNQSQMKQEPV